MSLPTRLLNVFAAPADVFDQLKTAAPSTANWLAPALLLIAVSWLGTWLIFSQETFKRQISEYSEKAVEKQIALAHMSPAQADQARAMGEKMAAISSTVGPIAGALYIAFAMPFLWGLILWLVGAKILKGGFPYLKAVEAVGLANTVAVLGAVVQTLLILALGNVFASPSLALLVKDFDPQVPVHSLMAAVNIFTFWILLVRAIGLSRLTGISIGKAAIWVFGIWVAYTGFFAGLGFAMQAAFRR
jgi:hypothetical protein